MNKNLLGIAVFLCFGLVCQQSHATEMMAQVVPLSNVEAIASIIIPIKIDPKKPHDISVCDDPEKEVQAFVTTLQLTFSIDTTDLDNLKLRLVTPKEKFEECIRALEKSLSRKLTPNEREQLNNYIKKSVSNNLVHKIINATTKPEHED